MKNNTKLLNILEVVFAALVGIALLLALILVGDMLMPQRWDYGATWDMYLQEDEDTIDVMFFGTSLAYCDVIPPLIYETTGLTSYVLAGPAQTAEQTYYTIREAMKTQSPQAIFVEVSCAFSNEDLFPHINVGYMPWSYNRLAATFTTERGEWAGLLFPLYSYHSRFVQESDEQDRMLFNSPTDDLCGYTYLNTSVEIESNTTSENWKNSPDDGSVETGLKYFAKISEFCAAEGVKLYFYFTPTTRFAPEKAMEMLVAGLSEIECETVYDFSDMALDIGISYATDWYDAGHLNFRGAKKFTEFLSIVIVQLGLEPNGTENTELWNARVENIRKK